jgi:hypothetical protein
VVCDIASVSPEVATLSLRWPAGGKLASRQSVYFDNFAMPAWRDQPEIAGKLG